MRGTFIFQRTQLIKTGFVAFAAATGIFAVVLSSSSIRCSVGFTQDCEDLTYDPSLNFLDYCKDSPNSDVKHTVEAVLAATKTKTCDDAWTFLQAVNALTLEARDLRDIRPLSNLSHLIYLNLGRNQILDLRPIRSMPELKSLGLTGNKIEDLSPLSSLTELISLDLSANPLKTVEGLDDLHNLRILRLDHTQVEDLRPIKSLRSLHAYDFFKGLTMEDTPILAQGIESSATCTDGGISSPALKAACRLPQN